MCGLFDITPKSRSNNEERQTKQEQQLKEQSAHEQPLTHARVNAIMGAPSSYRVHEDVIKERLDKRRASFPFKKTTTGHQSFKKGIPSAEAPMDLRIGTIRSKSLDNLKYESMGASCSGSSRPLPRTRPRLYERRKFPSSPLANIEISGDLHQGIVNNDPDRIESLASISITGNERIQAIDFQPKSPVPPKLSEYNSLRNRIA
ncbi:hypothetical protein ACLMJK_002946 [Lecanora helva]